MPHALTSLLIKPTSADCNLACEYCFYLKKSSLYPDASIHRMPDDVLEAIIRQVMELRQPNFSIGWQGGEPTLMGVEFFEKAVEYMKRYGGPGQSIGNGLQTNGLLIDDRWGEFLAEYQFLVGLSLDGPAKYHNRFRKTRGGGETHVRVIQAIDILRRHRVEFNCLIVVNRLNVHDPDGVFDFFRDNDLRYLQFIPAVERREGGGPGELADFTPDPEDFGRFMIRIFERWAEDDPPAFSIRWFDNLLMRFSGRPMASCTMKPVCGDYLAIEHNGDVYPCDFFVDKKWRLGNLTQTPMIELANTRTFDRFCAQKKELAPKCRNCRWLELCYGGCIKDRRAVSESPKAASYLCQAYKLFYDRTTATFERLAQRHRQPTPPPLPAPAVRAASPAAPMLRSGATKANVSRNAPCPCGSGKKFKRCCGK